MKDCECGRGCGMCGGEEICMRVLMAKDHLDYLGLGGKIILKWI